MQNCNLITGIKFIVEKLTNQIKKESLTLPTFTKLDLNEQQRPHPGNVSQGWRNRNHAPLRIQMEHICQQDLRKNTEPKRIVVIRKMPNTAYLKLWNPNMHLTKMLLWVLGNEVCNHLLLYVQHGNTVRKNEVIALTGCLRRNAAILSSFSSGSMEQVLYTNTPPGLTNLSLNIK